MDYKISPSTLLVSRKVFSSIKKYSKKSGNLQELFHRVIISQSISNFKSHYPTSKKITYQVVTGNYIKINFRPEPGDWEILRTMAIARRISMTFLFNLLFLEYCNKKGYKKWGVPTKIPIISLKLLIISEKISINLKINKQRL